MPGGAGNSAIEHNYVLYYKEDSKSENKESKILDFETGKSYLVPINLTHNQNRHKLLSCITDYYDYARYLLFTDNKGVIYYYNMIVQLILLLSS